jgi:hypothetical protein
MAPALLSKLRHRSTDAKLRKAAPDCFRVSQSGFREMGAAPVFAAKILFLEDVEGSVSATPPPTLFSTYFSCKTA